MSGFHKRTIRKLIRSKVEKFLFSIKDEEVRALAEKDILVTGGAIASMMLGEKVNDYDIYFRTKDTTIAVAKYLVAKFVEAKNARGSDDFVHYQPEVKIETRLNIKGEEEDRVLIYMQSAGVAGEQQESYQYFETRPASETEDFMASLTMDDGDEIVQVEEMAEIVKKADHSYRPVFMTDNAITLTDRVQVIIRFYGEPAEIHKNYDYIHCTGVYDYSKDQLDVSTEMMEALLSKTLVYNGSMYPLASILRMRKFIKRGWRISAGQVIKIMEQVSHIDFNDAAVLKEQLMGVDVAYMHQLIVALQNRETGQRIDSTYLAALIDQIFED